MMPSGQYYCGHWPVLRWTLASIIVVASIMVTSAVASIQTEIYSEQFYQDQQENLREVIKKRTAYSGQKGSQQKGKNSAFF